MLCMRIAQHFKFCVAKPWRECYAFLMRRTAFSLIIVISIVAVTIGVAALSPWREYHIEINGFADAAPKRITLLPFFRAALVSATDSAFREPINILLLGVPGEGNPAPRLTDTIMVARLDPIAQKVFLFSLPRDLLVRAPDAPHYTRLNALYEKRGVTTLRLKVEDITGLAIHRYALVDLQAVREVVDALGGVNTYVEKDIHDQRFPSGNFGYETFELKAGWRYLDGDTAVRFARTRNDPGGDFSRMRRQQQLLAALRQKIRGLSFLWDAPVFLKIFDSVNAHVESNLNAEELVRLFAWGRAISDTDVVLVPLDADFQKQLFTTGEFWFGAEKASIVKPLAGIEGYGDTRAYVNDVVGHL